MNSDRLRPDNLATFKTSQGQVDILNLSVDNVAQPELLQSLKEGGIVFTPNVDHLVKLQKDPEFYDAYQCATYRTCDSQILLYISKLLKQPIQEKISGSDLFPAFCNYYAHDPDIDIFLLGAAEGVGERARKRINRRVGRNMVIAAHSPSYGFEQDEAECDRIIDMINASKASVLAIGVGAPKQEKWVAKYKDRLRHVKVILAIGATIDFEAGHVKRSPKWMSQAGLEWLYRMMSEPNRLWKRYLIEDLPIFWMIFRQQVWQQIRQIKLD